MARVKHTSPTGAFKGRDMKMQIDGIYQNRFQPFRKLSEGEVALFWIELTCKNMKCFNTAKLWPKV